LEIKELWSSCHANNHVVVEGWHDPYSSIPKRKDFHQPKWMQSLQGRDQVVTEMLKIFITNYRLFVMAFTASDFYHQSVTRFCSLT